MGIALAETVPPFDPSRARRTIFAALIEAAKKFGPERKILIDGDERAFSYREIIRATLALGFALTRGTRFGESVGVLLPTGAASVLASLALCAYGRVPTMLNFTAGLQSVRAGIHMARVTRIV